MVESIKSLLKQRTFHLIKYTVSRVRYHLTSDKQSNNNESVVEFYAKSSESRPRQKFLLILSLTVFFETILLHFSINKIAHLRTVNRRWVSLFFCKFIYQNLHIFINIFICMCK